MFSAYATLSGKMWVCQEGELKIRKKGKENGKETTF
jgi:hypothetical protein